MNLNKDWASGKGAPTRRNVRMLIDENYMLNSYLYGYAGWTLRRSPTVSAIMTSRLLEHTRS